MSTKWVSDRLAMEGGAESRVLARWLCALDATVHTAWTAASCQTERLLAVEHGGAVAVDSPRAEVQVNVVNCAMVGHEDGSLHTRAGAWPRGERCRRRP